MRAVIIASIVIAASIGMPAQTKPEQATAQIKNALGQPVGNITLTETPHGVLVHVRLTAAPQGAHAFHVHEVGKCEPPFTSAGDHHNPTRKQHGIQNAMGMHAGDLPNIQASADGRLTLDVLVTDVTLKPGPTTLFDADGSAIVMHQQADDYTTDPTGNAGDRIACGVIAR